VNRADKAGAGLGFLSLVSATVLPFSNIVNGPGTSLTGAQSLLGNFLFFLNNLNLLQSDKVYSLVTLGLLYMSAFLLVLAGGVFGVFPPWSGFMEILGMLITTLGPFAVFQNFSFTSVDYGIGFYVLWVLSVASIVTWVLFRKSPTAKVQPVAPSGPP
jgi:hypothetical protein